MSQIDSLLEQGDTFRRQGFLTEAENRYQQALTLAESAIRPGFDLGPAHTKMAECWCKLGRLSEQAERTEEADRCYHRALEIYARVDGDEYFELALARDRIAVP